MRIYYCVLCGFQLRQRFTEDDEFLYLDYVCEDCHAVSAYPPEQRVPQGDDA